MAKKPPIISSNRRVLRLRSVSDIKEFLQTLLLVVPLTILIWVYAERAQITDDKIQLRVDIVPSDVATTTARIIDPRESPTVVLTVDGPRSRLRNLRDALESKAATEGGVFPLRLGAPYAPGTRQDIDLAREFSNNPLFSAAGVTVKDATPSRVSVEFEGFVECEARIVLPHDLAFQVTDATFDPPTIKLRGPGSALRQVIDLNKPMIEADFTSVASRLGAPGPQKIENIQLRLPRDPHITADHNSVASSFVAGQREEELTIPKITIAVQSPLVEYGKYKVDLKQKVVQNLKVKGTKDALAPLTDPNNPRLPTAVLRVSQADVNKDNLHRAVEITELPKGIILVGTPPEVDFTVTEAPDGP